MNNQQTGFTIIELMITMAIFALTLTVGVPSFKDTLNQNRLAIQVNDFITTLNLARSEAIKRSIQITVCKSAIPSAISPECTVSGSWSQGWITFVDSDKDGVVDGEEVLRTHAALNGDIVLTQDDNFSDWIGYLPTGSSLGDGGAALGDFTLCHAPYARVLTISNTGRISLAKAGC